MQPAERKSSFEQLIEQANKKSSTIRKSNIQQTKENDQQNKSSNKKTDEPSNLQLIKELIKAASILLATIFILIKNSKTYIKHRKNPQLKTSQYHKRPTFSVDKLPVYQPKQDVPNYTILLEQYLQTHGRKLKPVKRKPGKKRPPEHAHCQFCDAPAKYLSLNDGKKSRRVGTSSVNITQIMKNR